MSAAAARVILLVEDEGPVRQVMERALVNHGYHVIPAGSADEALQLAARHPLIDLLITDIVMRGMNGRDLAATMRRDRPRLGVLYVSGFTQKQTGLDGGDAFLEKPFAPADLVERVAGLLAG